MVCKLVKIKVVFPFKHKNVPHVELLTQSFNQYLVQRRKVRKKTTGRRSLKERERKERDSQRRNLVGNVELGERKRLPLSLAGLLPFILLSLKITAYLKWGNHHHMQCWRLVTVWESLE